MADVVGVAFRNGAKTYHFDPADLELSRGDRVVVQTMKGTEIGQVVEAPHVVDDSELSAPLKKVVRVATDEDLEAQAETDALRKEAMIACRELIDSHGLDMKLVDAEVSFGGDKITFSFYSDERVDFRALVSDLARTLKMRIELRQIGAREEARMVGGLGPCGRHLCCSLFPGDEDPVSIRMAKEQNLPLNPMKISGLCGRLMCCLKYEQDQYVTFRKEAPPKGTHVTWGDAEGAIIGYNVLKDAIVVRFEDGSIEDVKLGGCQADEHGCLNCHREVEQPKVLPLPEISYGGRLGVPDGVVEEPDQDRAEIAAVGEASPEASDSDGEAKTEGKSRSRRSRGRRGGRGRGANGTSADGSTASGGEQCGQAVEAGAGTRDAQPGGRSRRRKPGQTGERPAGGSPERPAETSGGAPGEGGAASGEGAAKRPRRRRRPRRRGGSPGEGGGDAGSGGNDGGGRSGASTGGSSGGEA